MTKEQALYSFYASFGLTAYEQSSVPTGDDAPDFPYLTYTVSTGSFGDGDIMQSVSLWYRSTSWTEINAKASEMAAVLSRTGKLIRYDGGSIWLRAGKPFAQSMGDPDDGTIRRKLINIVAEFISDT